MNTNFTFPRQQSAIPRPRPIATASTETPDPVNRDSNALRASVLDAALELGIGNNSTVANWIFNSSIDEVEEEELRSPTLTTETSESQISSTRYSSTPPTSNHLSPTASQQYVHLYNPHLLAVDRPPQASFDSPPEVMSNVPTPSAVVFPDIPIPQRPTTPSGRGKLRKKRSDGYQSDGGYVSDGWKKKKDKTKRTAKEDVSVNTELDKKEQAKEAKTRAKEEKLQEKREKEEERKRKKMLASKASKKSDDSHITGYHTDGAVSGKASSKAKSKGVRSKTVGDVGYETDSGYLSSISAAPKRKSRFFKLGTKQSKPDLPVEDPMPPFSVDKEPMTLPIAQRFATAMGSSGSENMVDIFSSRISNATKPPSIVPSLSISTSQSVFTSPSTTTSTTIANFSSSASSTAFVNFPPVSGRNAGIDRESYGSGESGSSGSSNLKRRGLHLASRDSGNGGRAESFSTITSSFENPFPASTSSSFAASKYPPVSTIPPSFSAATSSSIAIALPGHPYADGLRPAANSLTNSPFFSPSPRSNPGSHSPSPIISQSQELVPPSPSALVAPLRLSPQVRPRNPPTNGFGPRPTTNPTQNGLAPITQIQEWASAPMRRSPTPSQLSIVPSSEYIVPSPRGTPLPSPNVFAHYDIPPPSPPPTGPLPNVPGSSTGLPPSALRRPQTQDRDPARANWTRDHGWPSRSLAPTGIQRGKQTPFPVRPISPSVLPSEGIASEKEEVAKYEDLHLATQPLSGDVKQMDEMDEEELDSTVVKPMDAEGNRDDNDEEEDIRGVLERFEDTLSGEQAGRALGRSRSFEAIKKRLPGHVPSEYYEDDDDDIFSDEKTSTESGWERNSTYSRGSFLDPDKSESTRERFLQRVADMYGGGGRNSGQAIPPMPRLPDSLLNRDVGALPSGRSWNRF